MADRWLTDPARLHLKRWAVIWLGLIVLATPTALTIWADEWAEAPTLWKVSASVAWPVLAFVLVRAGVDRDHQVGRLAGEVTKWRDDTRALAEGFAFRAILHAGETVFPPGWQFTVYVYVPSHDRLEPVWPTPWMGESDVRAFTPPNGATGLAWSYDGVVTKYGDEVHDSTHGLTEEQQVAFADYNAVVSTAIFSERAKRIGVLSAISRDEDNYFDEMAHQELLKNAATTVGALMGLRNVSRD